jgi:hypothetical protein
MRTAVQRTIAKMAVAARDDSWDARHAAQATAPAAAIKI